jgi:hypothetical protein
MNSDSNLEARYFLAEIDHILKFKRQTEINFGKKRKKFVPKARKPGKNLKILLGF